METEAQKEVGKRGRNTRESLELACIQMSTVIKDRIKIVYSRRAIQHWMCWMDTYVGVSEDLIHKIIY